MVTSTGKRIDKRGRRHRRTAQSIGYPAIMLSVAFMVAEVGTLALVFLVVFLLAAFYEAWWYGR